MHNYLNLSPELFTTHHEWAPTRMGPNRVSLVVVVISFSLFFFFLLGLFYGICMSEHRDGVDNLGVHLCS